jgi:hypothetical protein
MIKLGPAKTHRGKQNMQGKQETVKVPSKDHHKERKSPRKGHHPTFSSGGQPHCTLISKQYESHN